MDSMVTNIQLPSLKLTISQLPMPWPRSPAPWATAHEGAAPVARRRCPKAVGLRRQWRPCWGGTGVNWSEMEVNSSNGSNSTTDSNGSSTGTNKAGTQLVTSSSSTGNNNAWRTCRTRSCRAELAWKKNNAIDDDNCSNRPASYWLYRWAWPVDLSWQWRLCESFCWAGGSGGSMLGLYWVLVVLSFGFSCHCNQANKAKRPKTVQNGTLHTPKTQTLHCC